MDTTNEAAAATGATDSAPSPTCAGQQPDRQAEQPRDVDDDAQVSSQTGVEVMTADVPA